jgi:hypothetical protein
MMMFRRLTATALVLLTTFAMTAQQAVGIVSTVANLVDIVEGRNTAPVQVNQPVVEGAAYRATGHSAAEFTFPGGLRAAAGPSSSVAFHPSPAGAGTRLVSVSEGLFRFALPTQGSRIDVQTPYGAFRAVAAAPNSEIVVKVDADGSVKVATTSGSVEIRDFSSGALLVLLENGQAATLTASAAAAPAAGVAASLAMAVVATGAIDAQTGAQLADLNALLAGQFAAQTPPTGGAAAGDATAQGLSNSALLGWGLGGAALVGGVVAAAVTGGGGHHGSSTTTTTTTTTGGE